MKMPRVMRWLVLATVLLISVQLLLIAFQGEVACLNDGCRVLEGLTRISPFWFNLLGLGYFAALYALLVWMPAGGGALLPLFLAAGLGAEGVLLGYQMVVAKTFCAYCLVIFSVVLTLNLLAGSRQAVAGIAGLAGAIAIFPLLRLGPEVAAARKLTLTSGTYGVLRAAPTRHDLYLFFSETCEHCRGVMRHLPAGGGCSVHLNPIGPLKSDPVTGLEKPASFVPEVNRAMLSFLGIGEIPVLIERKAETLRIIKGEKPIIAFLAETCAESIPGPLLPEIPYPVDIPPEEGECSITTESCPSE